MSNHRAHLALAASLWIALTVVGEFLAFVDVYPTVGSDEAKEADEIFRFLMILGVPVFAFVIAVLAYGVLRFRSPGGDEPGPSIRGEGWVPRVWVGITSGLAIFVIIFPGLWGVAQLRENGDDYGLGAALEDDVLQVDILGFRWAWSVEYPSLGISGISPSQNLVLPVDRQVVFNITSSDVLHSFWVPAFRMKIDAIPGRTTRLTLTPTRTGGFITDASYRLQCAELCGLGHTDMQMNVVVLEEEEFEAWVAEQRGGE